MRKIHAKDLRPGHVVNWAGPDVTVTRVEVGMAVITVWTSNGAENFIGITSTVLVRR
ncbi:hypothetical protein [Kitasatospora sp. NPDC047058]|uniref:hypothetical protein n=1 Tax=Kitasatospora sp. NPDC047058 TaxID=3155620 RepID=UPI0033C50295